MNQHELISIVKETNTFKLHKCYRIGMNILDNPEKPIPRYIKIPRMNEWSKPNGKLHTH